MWDFTDGKQYHNRASTQNSCSAGGYPEEHVEWDFALYMDILTVASSQRKYDLDVLLIEVYF